MDTSATEPAIDERTTAARTHDICFTTSARQSFMHIANRGVTLTPDAIAWAFDGKPDGAPFKNIVDVCVKKGPGAHRFIRICEIAFADHFKLLVTDGNEFGIPTEARRAAYRGFMHDLHARRARRRPRRTTDHVQGGLRRKA
jgi:hypothetical protein